jgi:hypothetical protein
MELHAIGIDLGKTVFHLVGLSQTGEITVGRSSLALNFFASPRTFKFA